MKSQPDDAFLIRESAAQGNVVSYRNHHCKDLKGERVCLINPPINMTSRLWYPIGIGHIAAALREEGAEVEVIDVVGDNLSRREFAEKLTHSKAKVFGIGGLLMAFNEVVWIADLIKTQCKDAFVFAGNTVAYTIPDILLRNSMVDVVVMGEGENTAADLVRNRKSLEDVKGIAYRNDGGLIVKTPPREPIESLDDISLPAWDLLPMKNYFENLGRNTYPLSTVRGCPYSCTFCCKTFIGYKVRARSAQGSINELVEVKQRFNIGFFYLFDDLFIFDKKRVLEFCQLKNDHKGLRNLQWEASARVNHTDEELVNAMRSAGCVGLSFGFESADQAVLDSYNKRATVEQAQKAIDICRRYGIDLSGSSFLIGAINETPESVRKTHEFCRKNGLRYEPHFVTPYPATPLYDYALESGLIKDELEYIRKLSTQGNTNHLLLNLTQMPDEELTGLRDKYVYFPPDRFGITLRRGLNIMKTAGLRTFMRKAISYSCTKTAGRESSEKKHSNVWL